MGLENTTRTETWRGYAGRTGVGDRVWVQIELRHHDGAPEGRTYTRTDHRDYAPGEGYVSLSVTIAGLDKGRQRRHGSTFGGAMSGDILRRVRVGRLMRKGAAEGLRAADLDDLARIADEWHLNDMRAACEHLPRDYDPTGQPVEAWPVCEETGYRWGGGWLVAEIPDDVVERVRQIAEQLDGDHIDYV